MKKFFTLVFFIILSSCNILKDRTVDKVNENVKIFDRSTITTKGPGDVIILPAPQVPWPLRKDTVIIYKGKKGATATTKYDKDGNIIGQIINCPEVEETKRLNIKEEYNIKTKQIESKANIELANTIGKWSAKILIPIGLFFAIAFFLRGIT